MPIDNLGKEKGEKLPISTSHFHSLKALGPEASLGEDDLLQGK
jgi:hypothetical protein